MHKSDLYLINTINSIISNGKWDSDPRPRWKDSGKPAYSKFITQQTNRYDISKGEIPLNSIRKTAVKGAFYDIKAIYIDQTNKISEMHPSIHSWWEDFVVNPEAPKEEWHIGQTYGHTVKRFNMVDTLLEGMIKNPFGRRHMINLWQVIQMIEDPKALVPCAYETLYSFRDEVVDGQQVRFMDMTLGQRSQDLALTSDINPFQYVVLGMMILGHLNKNTKVNHQFGIFEHRIQNSHLYDMHIPLVKEMLSLRKPKKDFKPTLYLKENKNFYDYDFSDFVISQDGVEPLPFRFPMAV